MWRLIKACQWYAVRPPATGECKQLRKKISEQSSTIAELSRRERELKEIIWQMERVILWNESYESVARSLWRRVRSMVLSFCRWPWKVYEWLVQKFLNTAAQ